MSTYEEFASIMRKAADLEYSIAVLNWDKEVNLPARGANTRSRQISTIIGIAHEMITSKKMGDLLYELNEQKEKLSPKEARNVTLALKEYQKNTKFEKAFVERRSEIISKTYHTWLAARKANKYNKEYKNALADFVQIKREEAQILGYEDHPYDALMDKYESGAKVKDLDILFKDVREQLVDFVSQLRKRPQVNNAFLYQHYDKDKQWEYGLKVLKDMGFDFEAGRQDISTHPFTINFSPNDVRVTTRIDEKSFSTMTWGCIHEGGHALYEQGLPTDAYGLPISKYISLGIHESQSRLWENNVGRSLAYWKANYSDLQKRFPENLNDISLEQFYHGINKTQPSLIRVESDELHYHFHILIRYEIEKGLIEGSISVENLREIWNTKYKTYLNVDVPDDNHGVLQDIHWAHGSLGYFPTYSLGSFYAAQFFNQAKKDIPNLVQQIETGDTSQLLQWLRTNIHQHGKLYGAEEICKRVTGEKLNFKYFMKYAREKYEGIYGI